MMPHARSRPLLGAVLVAALSAGTAPGQTTGPQDFARPAPRGAEAQIALVIGNSDYEGLDDLPNAGRDADLVAAHFRELGYRTIALYDADFADMADAVQDVARLADAETTIVFYYAGHGMQVGAANYLLPTDARIEGLFDLPFAALPLGTLMESLSARAGAVMVVLDSCRDTPFQQTPVVTGLETATEQVEAGFFFQASPLDTFVAFSTSPGGLANDGAAGGNSPFTSAFVSAARSSPGADVTRLMARTRRDVVAATGGEQIPWETSSLTRPVGRRSAGASPRGGRRPLGAVRGPHRGSVTTRPGMRPGRGVAVCPVDPVRPRTGADADAGRRAARPSAPDRGGHRTSRGVRLRHP